jgi:hypothetical protein
MNPIKILAVVGCLAGLTLVYQNCASEKGLLNKTPETTRSSSDNFIIIPGLRTIDFASSSSDQSDNTNVDLQRNPIIETGVSAPEYNQDTDSIFLFACKKENRAGKSFISVAVSDILFEGDAVEITNLCSSGYERYQIKLDCLRDEMPNQILVKLIGYHQPCTTSSSCSIDLKSISILGEITTQPPLNPGSNPDPGTNPTPQPLPLLEKPSVSLSFNGNTHRFFPTNITAESEENGSSRLQISWQPVPQAQSYSIWKTNFSNNTRSRVWDGTNTQHSIYLSSSDLLRNKIEFDVVANAQNPDLSRSSDRILIYIDILNNGFCLIPAGVSESTCGKEGSSVTVGKTCQINQSPGNPSLKESRYECINQNGQIWKKIP